MFVVAAFYHFFDFSHFAEEQQKFKAEMNRFGIKGSLLIAPEGVNGTLSGTREGIDQFLSFLKTEIIHGELEHKESLCETQPFARAKVRLKKETISLGEKVDMSTVGHYVDPKDWNALISDPDTIVLDTRNDYEVHMGTFERAIDPHIRTFKELPAFVREKMSQDKQAKIATFCTGGIRCEKFTAWMLNEGFENVYHLKGGILKYLEEVSVEQSTWNGECYVFDDRIAVGHGVAASQTATHCPPCGSPLTPEDRLKPEYIEGKRCAFCADGSLSHKRRG